jgi:hypothetical protein
MDSGAEAFDVAAVVNRANGMDLATASEAELAWADRAGDRIQGWLDAWRAQVHFEMTIPRPLPDLAAERPSDDHHPADVSPGQTPADPEGDATPPLPSLGSSAPPPESAAERERKARRSWLLSCLSAFAEALRTGRITTGHVDVLAAAADRLPPAIRDRVIARGDELLSAAIGATPEKFSRSVQRIIAKAYDDEGIDRAAALRQRSGLRRGVDDATKMHWLHLQLDPERGAILFSRLTAEREAIFHGGHHKGLTNEQVELQALLNLVRPITTATTPGGGDEAPVRTQKSSTKRIHGLVLIDATTWLEGAHDRTVCESASGVPLPPDAVRRLLCWAEITYGFLFNGRIVASVAGNDLATPEQRHELRMMYRTCCHPDCRRPFDKCQIHHVIARSRHGPTDVALMVPLCTDHHDLIHHRGWGLAIDTERTLTWTAPDGTTRITPFVPLAELDQAAQPSLFGHGTAPPTAA